jgi:DNA-binding protein WhiA
MGAFQSTLQWENARAYRSLQGRVNRQVNCDLANSTKVSQAGENQIRAIRTIQEKAGLEMLPRPLQDMARLRLANPDLPLKELGELLDPPVGKSGVNHRLRKLMQIADGLS